VVLYSERTGSILVFVHPAILTDQPGATQPLSLYSSLAHTRNTPTENIHDMHLISHLPTIKVMQVDCNMFQYACPFSIGIGAMDFHLNLLALGDD
jgi:hypothetical protein